MDRLSIRNIKQQDHGKVIAVVNDWWGGRDMTCMLPKLFFTHFRDTSYIAECDKILAGFLLGFVSQSQPEEAYIHFAGVNPEYRKRGIADELYNLFFSDVKARGCKVVRCITSPVNRGSISFHRHIGFQIESGNKETDGLPVTENYDGKGEDRVLFYKVLDT